MILRDEDLKVLENVPAGKWHEVMDLARKLAEEHQKKINSGKKRDRPRLWGVLKGKVWMSEDFNEPMELVYESELRELRELAGRNTPEVKKEKPYRSGEWVDEIYMSDDFDDHLEFVSPEELKVLEAMREAKK